MQLALIGGLGTWELLVILIIALLIFGSRLPSVMRNLGKSVNEFKTGMNEVTKSPPAEEVHDRNDDDVKAEKDDAKVA